MVGLQISDILLVLLFAHIGCFGRDDLARNKRTNQSTIQYGKSQMAVNGNPSDCTFTLQEEFNWWFVDLDEAYQIDKIELVVNKITGNVMKKMDIFGTNHFDFVNREFWEICHRVNDSEVSGKPHSFKCFGKTNTPSYRYLGISRDNLPTTICSFEAYEAGEMIFKNDSFLGNYKDVETVSKDNIKSEYKCSRECRKENHQGFFMKDKSCMCVKKLGNVEAEWSESSVPVNSVCPLGLYGSECGRPCHCKNSAPCDLITGHCSNGCHESYSGVHCNEVNMDTLKFNCGASNESTESLKECQKDCYILNNDFFYFDGVSCKCDNFTDADLNKHCDGVEEERFMVCPRGFYGYKCSSSCHCKDNSSCHLYSGKCLNGCEEGWKGESCSEIDCRGSQRPIHCVTKCEGELGKKTIWHACSITEEKIKSNRFLMILLISLILLCILLTLGIIAILLYRKKKFGRKMKQVPTEQDQPDVILKRSNPQHL